MPYSLTGNKPEVPKLRNYRSQTPFLVVYTSGEIASSHYEGKAAIAAAKLQGVRHIVGRHQGDWKHLLTYVKGVKQ